MIFPIGNITKRSQKRSQKVNRYAILSLNGVPVKRGTTVASSVSLHHCFPHEISKESEEAPVCVSALCMSKNPDSLLGGELIWKQTCFLFKCIIACKKKMMMGKGQSQLLSCKSVEVIAFCNPVSYTHLTLPTKA